MGNGIIYSMPAGILLWFIVRLGAILCSKLIGAFRWEDWPASRA